MLRCGKRWRTLRIMLFMVIERFRHGDAGPIGKRVRLSGRMLPEGITYHASWVDSAGTRCFQVMEWQRIEPADVVFETAYTP